MRISKWTPVVVHWGDATTLYESVSSNGDFKLAERSSIGFFLKQTAEAVVICMEDDRLLKGESTMDCETVTVIPHGMIRSIDVLAVSKTKPAKGAAPKG